MDILDVLKTEPLRRYATQFNSSVDDGIIYGVQYALCRNTEIDWIYTMALKRKTVAFECTEEQYDRFKEIMEELYPNFCEFDV